MVKVSSPMQFLIFWLYGKTQRLKSAFPGVQSHLTWAVNLGRWEQTCTSHRALGSGSLCGVSPDLSLSEHSCISHDWITTNPFFIVLVMNRFWMVEPPQGSKKEKYEASQTAKYAKLSPVFFEQANLYLFSIKYFQIFFISFGSWKTVPIKLQLRALKIKSVPIYKHLFRCQTQKRGFLHPLLSRGVIPIMQTSMDGSFHRFS